MIVNVGSGFYKTKHTKLQCRIRLDYFNTAFNNDRTNGRAYATVLRSLSVCRRRL